MGAAEWRGVRNRGDPRDLASGFPSSSSDRPRSYEDPFRPSHRSDAGHRGGRTCGERARSGRCDPAAEDSLRPARTDPGQPDLPTCGPGSRAALSSPGPHLDRHVPVPHGSGSPGGALGRERNVANPLDNRLARIGDTPTAAREILFSSDLFVTSTRRRPFVPFTWEGHLRRRPRAELRPRAESAARVGPQSAARPSEPRRTGAKGRAT